LLKSNLDKVLDDVETKCGVDCSLGYMLCSEGLFSVTCRLVLPIWSGVAHCEMGKVAPPRYLENAATTLAVDSSYAVSDFFSPDVSEEQRANPCVAMVMVIIPEQIQISFVCVPWNGGADCDAYIVRDSIV
jgi:hypothetical protein